jgi:hypothetical protein
MKERPSQSEKQSEPNDSTYEGIQIDFSDDHDANARCPKIVTQEPRSDVIAESPLQFQKRNCEIATGVGADAGIQIRRNERQEVKRLECQILQSLPAQKETRRTVEKDEGMQTNLADGVGGAGVGRRCKKNAELRECCGDDPENNRELKTPPTKRDDEEKETIHQITRAERKPVNIRLYRGSCRFAPEEFSPPSDKSDIRFLKILHFILSSSWSARNCAAKLVQAAMRNG